MTDSERKANWLKFIRGSQTTYRLNAIKALYEAEGLAMLENCLAELGWERSVDLIKAVEAPELIR